MYLGLATGRTANSCSSLSRWQNSGDFVAGVFSRQAIPMLWDYAETNVFSTSTQNWMAQVNWVAEAIATLPAHLHQSHAFQDDAASPSNRRHGLFISTDPPYYDNVGYADLSDFFYVWLRRRCSKSSQTSSLHLLRQRPRNWSRPRIVMEIERRQRRSSLTG